MAWSWSGSVLAVGQQDGCVSLYDSAGLELGQTSWKGAIAGMAWTPLRWRPSELRDNACPRKIVIEKQESQHRR